MPGGTMFLFRKALFHACAVVLGLALISPAHAGKKDNFSVKVFNFQLKLAQDGKVNSQYKLGRMYETGQGTDQDMQQALHWFSEASTNGFEAAADRMMFHEIRDKGYSSERYGNWVDGIVDRARSGDHESMRLLSEMYIDGLGVRRDERKALKLLLELSKAGYSEVDADIARLESKLSAGSSGSAEPVLILRRASVGGRSAAGIYPAKQVRSSSMAPGIVDGVEPAFEKRRRYEAVMRSLHKEQRMLEEQQRWAEDGS